MTVFENLMCCFLIPCAYVLIYIAGKYDILAVTCEMLREWADKHTEKRGRWIAKREPISWCEDDVEVFFECSVCGTQNFGESPYCPNCGKPMDGGAENGE